MMKPLPITPLETPCIEWAGYRAKCGYGQRSLNGKPTYVHRIAYCEHHGLKLSDIAGKVVRHDCDNPICINPAHLQLGTRADNARDRVTRNRQFLNILRGEESPAAKITEADVIAIRNRCVPFCRVNGQSALAREYGLTSGQVCRIFRRKMWSATQ